MASLKEYQSMSAPPSVSNEQWKKYALKKMSSGYFLIISGTRNFARFYKGHGALENCSYRTAKKLLQLGYLEEVGEHVMGTIYQLSATHRDQEALLQVSQSKMGVVQTFDDEEDAETDDLGYELDTTLSDDSEDVDEDSGDVNPTVT